MSDSDDTSRSTVEEIVQGDEGPSEGSEYTEESYYEEEVVEVSARDDDEDDDSCLETLPPPISIPDVFKTHELEDEDAKKRSFNASFDDDTGRVRNWMPTSSAGNVIKNAVHVSDSESDSSNSEEEHDERLQSCPPFVEQQKEIENDADCESENYSDEEEEEPVPPPVVEKVQPAPPSPAVNNDPPSPPLVVNEKPASKPVAQPKPAPSAVVQKAPPSPVKKEASSTIRPATIITNSEPEPEDTNNPYAWKKPDWTKKKVLRSTDNGEKFKKEGTLSVPITKIAEVTQEKKNLAFEKPDWTKKKVLKSSLKGQQLKKGETISRPIGGIKAIDS